MNIYMSGALVKSKARFRNELGVDADPDTVTLKYKLGSGAVVTKDYPVAGMTKDSTGNYHWNFDTTGWAGPDNLLYLVEWIGTGAVTAIDDDAWEVEPPTL